ncbi:MAG: flagellar motor protein MotB [Ferrimicrobium sp.]
MRRGGHIEEAENSERWLLTYADMITLLLALFVVLFAMSSINVRKFTEFKTGVLKTFASASLTTAPGGGSGVLQHRSLISHPGATPSPPQITPPGVGVGTPSSSTIAKEILQALQKANLSQDAQVIVQRRGVVVRILSDKVFFNSDSASLGSAGNAVVDVLASVIRAIPNDVAIEGYTDSAPIYGGPYSTNFELSAVRAVTVLERLIKVDGISSSRLSATGFGDTHPVVPNTSPTNMALNRRVDVVVLNTASANRI